MQNEMSLGVFVEGCVADNLLVIAAVIVQVAGHPQLALDREIDGIEIANGRIEVFVGGDLESFDDALGGGRHSGGVIGVKSGKFVNDDLLASRLNTKTQRTRSPRRPTRRY